MSGGLSPWGVRFKDGDDGARLLPSSTIPSAQKALPFSQTIFENIKTTISVDKNVSWRLSASGLRGNDA